MTRLQQMQIERGAANERLRLETRRLLHATLTELLTWQTVILFGSLTKADQFGDFSDVDLALADEPPDLSVYQLTSLLAERLGRRVDMLLLSECRFHEKIEREGETWSCRVDYSPP